MVGNAAPVFVVFFLNMLDSRSNMFFGTVASNTAIDFYYIYILHRSKFFGVFSFKTILQKGLNPLILVSNIFVSTLHPQGVD